MSWRKMAAAGAAALVVGCGGGGGANSGGSSGPGTTPIDANAPTFQFNGRYTDERAIDLIMEIIDVGPQLLSYARFATDVAHRFADADSPTSVVANCAYTGRVSLQFNDRDGNRRTSAGDSITVVLENCGVPTLRRAVTGTLRVDIQSAMPSATTALQARLVIVDALQIGSMSGPNLGIIIPGTLRGSLGVQWAESSTGAQTRVTSTAEDDLRFTAVYDTIESVNQLRKIDVSQTVRYDLATIENSIALLFDTGVRGGMLRVRSSQPFRGDLDALPKQFRVDAEIASGQIIRAERATGTGTLAVVKGQLLSQTGAVQKDRMIDWGETWTLMHDSRQASVFNRTADEGGGSVTLLPWRKAFSSLDIDRACQQGVQPTSNRLRADALFQRPVAAEPALTEPDALIRLQFGRAIAQSTDLRFRLVDASETPDSASPTWRIPATAIRHGAYYEIRPAERLRQGRNYLLQVSLDGVDWTSSERFVRDEQGREVTLIGSSGVGNFYSDNAIVADTWPSDLATVSKDSPARLRAVIAVRDGQAVASYQWQQLSGPVLRLTTPQALETDAVLDANHAVTIADVLMQLTVTDVLGNVDMVRVAMRAGNQLAQGAVLYTESGNSNMLPRRHIGTGEGAIAYGPTPGALALRTAANLPIGLLVIPSNGRRLEVGSYPDALMSDSPGYRNGLIAQVFCNTEGSPTRSSFEVLDVAYTDDGAISRLAIDFAQRCEAGFGEYQRGSYRYNSAVLLRP